MHILKYVSLLLAFVGLLPFRSAMAWKLESAVITLPSTLATPSFLTVNFRQSYDVVPLVFALPTNEGGDPAAIRVRNVGLSSFEIIDVEPNANDGRHVAMNNVAYIAVEPGVHEFPDGTQVVAIAHATSSVQHGNGVLGSEAWDTVNWGIIFNNTPSVLGQIQTMANESSTPPATSSIPWLTTALRNVTTTTVQTALERSESGSGSVSVSETIGLLAIDTGAGGSLTGSFYDNSDTSISYQALISGDNITGNCVVTNFGLVYPAVPLVVASKNRHDGGDGGWLRRCAIGTSSITLQVEEDIDNDAERNHTTESAGMIIFSQAFDAGIFPGIEIQKTVSTFSDPVNGSDPKSIPGAIKEYLVSVNNQGLGPADAGSLIIIDLIPANTALVVTDIGLPGSGPVAFTDGATSSGLTYTFIGLGDNTDDVQFSDDNGISYTYAPIADANGTDTNVTHLRITPGRAGNERFLGRTAGNNPSFEVNFRVRVQ